MRRQRGKILFLRLVFVTIPIILVLIIMLMKETILLKSIYKGLISDAIVMTTAVSNRPSNTISNSNIKTKQSIFSKMLLEVKENLCNELEKQKHIGEFIILCNQGLVETVGEMIYQGHDVKILQIGAHIGFEENDPIARGLFALIDALGDFFQNITTTTSMTTPTTIKANNNNYSNKTTTMTTTASARITTRTKTKRSRKLMRKIITKEDVRSKFYWFFVEASPVNYKRLEINLASAKNDTGCEMISINAAVVPDNYNLPYVPFYSLNASIDPEDGFDLISKQLLPYWVTQVSGLTLKGLDFAGIEFTKRGLNIADYIVQTNVTAKRFSELNTIMEELIITNKEEKEKKKQETSTSTKEINPPLLIVIDTEGSDCDIIRGIPSDSVSMSLPKYLMFERHCPMNQYRTTYEHLYNNLGYNNPCILTRQNSVAIKQDTILP